MKLETKPANYFTGKDFWEQYWDERKLQAIDKLFFAEFVKDWEEGNKSLIEIGGFPGKFAAWFVREKHYEVTILDYIIEDNIVRRVEELNGLKPGRIKTIKTDFFNYTSSEKYDFVISVGFIEHFDDTADVIRRHVELLKPGGKLLITLPNFRGLNGWVQYLFDKENYNAHNINCMDIRFLNEAVKATGIEKYEIQYYGRPGLWLEDKEKTSRTIKWLIKTLSRLLSHLPIKNNLILTPNIILHGFK
jgi:SAM-dependent methyltransferase